jgi:3'-phosphoadenosine 5'-phosphosulfate sulfotransferase (PAPS reductase)/FAD synthetase
VLKIEPTIKYMESLPDDSVLYVGLRYDEEARRGIFGEDMKVRFPLREWHWTESDVWAYLDLKGICIPARTDCAMCPYQRLGEWRDLFEKHPERYQQLIHLEDSMGATLRSPGRDTWPADLRSLAEEFKSGRKLREYKRSTTCRVCSL